MRRTLRKALLPALVLGLSLATAPAAVASGQDDGLAEKYAKKLEKEFATKIKWTSTFHEARATAKEQGNMVLGYFTRSYAP